MEMWGHALWEQEKLAQDSSVHAGQVQAKHAGRKEFFLIRVSCELAAHKQDMTEAPQEINEEIQALVALEDRCPFNRYEV